MISYTTKLYVKPISNRQTDRQTDNTRKIKIKFTEKATILTVFLSFVTFSTTLLGRDLFPPFGVNGGHGASNRYNDPSE